ncbi:MAG: MFS transporter [Actinobacteria bacterium]|nr:MFS transporter [Actinomycetota bacterium]
MPGLWRHRDFLLLWGGQTVSQIGSQVTILALPLVAIVVLRASALAVGLLSAAATSAYLLVALPAGVLADRVSKRTVMIGCDLASVAVIGWVPAAQVAGILTLGPLYAVALLASALSAFFLVSYTSYLPSLIGRGQLVDGNGKLATTQSVALVAGPALGALLVGLVGAARAMAGDAISFAVAAGCLFLIRAREPRPGRALTERPARFWPQLREGLAYVLHEPILRNGAAWNGSANFFVIMVETLGPVFLIRTDHLRPAYVGLLLAAGALGGVAGGLASKPLAARIGSARLCWLAMTVFALPGLLIPAARPGWWVLLFAVGWMSWTFSATLCGTALTSYQQAACPERLRGRVSAVSRWVSWGTLPLGGLTAGLLGGVIGVHLTLWIAVAGGCLSGLWLYLSPLRRLRDLPAGGLQPA